MLNLGKSLSLPFVLFAICLIGLSAEAKYGGGSGTAEDPFLIYTAEQLYYIGTTPDDWDRHFKLMADIDLDPNLPDRKVFNDSVIGAGTFPSYFQNTAFSGTLDGNHHVIRNMVINAPDDTRVGLLNAVGPHGQVRNLGLDCVSVCGDAKVGGLVGDNWGEIAECYCSGTIIGHQNVGGLIGINSGYVQSCYSASEVIGTENAGGFVGTNDRETMSSARGRIISCYSSGSVSGDRWIGGMVGSNGGNISSSYSVGHVQGNTDAGGFVGSYSGLIYLCYWDTDRSGLDTSAAGTGKNTQEMMNHKTYRGWGYDNAWTIQDGMDYPRLHWEQASGDPLLDTPRSYGGGTGKPNNPYQIRTAEQFAAIAWYRADFSKHFVLVNDIDMQSIDHNEVIPIGTMQVPFTGVFDGNSHAILNYRYSAHFDDCVGLFRCIGPPCSECGIFWCDATSPCALSVPSGDNMSGVVKNLVLKNTEIVGGLFVGTLAGISHGIISYCHSDGTIMGDYITGGLVGHSFGVIYRCYSTVAVTGYNINTGGLAGHSRGKIISSWARGDVVGDQYVGGLVGTSGGLINNCFAAGGVAGDDFVGGLIGYNINTTQSCYSTATVTGNDEVGGLVGSNTGTLVHCYSTGLVNGIYQGGGLVGSDGFDEEGVSDSCYWDIETSGLKYSAGGLDRTTAEMKQRMTFVNWDFTKVWSIAENQTYPFLRWCPAGDLNGDCKVDFADLVIMASHWLD